MAAILADRKMDSSAVANNNKVKVMATQLLAKFEENAPAQQTGLKRQVGRSRRSQLLLVFLVPLGGNILTSRRLCCQSSGCPACRAAEGCRGTRWDV